MKILGYSERGIINAFFYEINYSRYPETLLHDFLSRVKFPFIDECHISVESSEVLIEQSLSDFGDSDVLLMINTGKNNISIFLEAKVKSFQRASWSIDDEYRKFIQGTKTRVNSSNLFTQLYHKVRMIEGLHNGGVPNLQAGIQFPKSSSKAVRKIGNNGIVLSAVEMLTNYLDDTFYVAILPDDQTNIERFFENEPIQDVPEGYSGWDVSHYGFISWSEVEAFCIEKNMQNSLRVFKYNGEQIYTKYS
jgi:hypothetical protein